jgi:hypothetical protein
MNTAPVLRFATATHVTTPSQPSGSTTSLDFVADQVAARLRDDPSFIDELVMRIHAQDIVNQVLAANMSGKRTNPFDAVYLCDLEPDVVPAAAILELERLKNIKDLSSEISFGDADD